jgi:3-phenylpropionate/cinnamic acid dioxygenase small subunit
MMRRVVTNIEAHYTKNESEFSATSYLLAHRLRPSAPEGGFYVAVRHDTLRRNGPDWRIAQRTVCLDQIMLFDGALSTLL